MVLYQREEEYQDACSYDPEKPQCVVRDKRHVTVEGRSPEEIWLTNQMWSCYSRLSRAELAREPSRAPLWSRPPRLLRVDDVFRACWNPGRPPALSP